MHHDRGITEHLSKVNPTASPTCSLLDAQRKDDDIKTVYVCMQAQQQKKATITASSLHAPSRQLRLQQALHNRSQSAAENFKNRVPLGLLAVHSVQCLKSAEWTVHQWKLPKENSGCFSDAHPQCLEKENEKKNPINSAGPSFWLVADTRKCAITASQSQ